MLNDIFVKRKARLTMNYKLVSGKTVAEVFFYDNSDSLKNCEAWVNKDGTLYSVKIHDCFYSPEELQDLRVSCVDFDAKCSLYIHPKPAGEVNGN